MLRGRSAEQAEIGNLLMTAAAGRGGAMVIRGDVGTGKSALLEHAVRSAAGMRVLRANGVDSEAGLPYAALHLLLSPVSGTVSALPAPQAAALRYVLGLNNGAMPDRRLVGYATLTMLSRLGAERPLLCVIDDAHDMDRPSADTLRLVARRLRAEGIAMIFSAGDSARGFSADGLPEVLLPGLDRDAARQMLADHVDELSPHTRERIVDEAAGNPLALRELSAALTGRQRAGLLPPEPLGLGSLGVRAGVYADFTARIGRLSASIRVLLQVVAADGNGNLAVVRCAAERLGASIDDVAAAERARLIKIVGDRITFRHPLIRPAVHHDGTLSRRIQVHGALAEAWEALGDRSASIWHRAAATTGPDELVADDLDRLAEQSAVRGAWSSAVAAHQRAAELSSCLPRRGRRLTAAATAASSSGDMCRAEALADDALSMSEDVRVLARLAAVRATVEAGRGSLRDAVWILLQGADLAGDDSPAVSAMLLMNAARHAWACDYRDAVSVAATRVAALRRSTHVDTCAAGVLGFAGVVEGDSQGWGSLRRMVSMVRGDRSGIPLEVRLRAIEAALLVGDDRTARDLATQLATVCRTLGRADLLPDVLHLLAQAQLFLGSHHEASTIADHAVEISRGAGNAPLVAQVNAVRSRIAAIEGDEERCRRLTKDPRAAGSLLAQEWSNASWTLLDLGLGRAEAAVSRFGESAAGSIRHTVVRPVLLADTLEAWTRTGRHDQARWAQQQLTDCARRSGAAWVKAVSLRCDALMDDGSAGDNYAEAVRLHRQGSGRPFERARTELLYGEWLRRNRRRTDARTQLRAALSGFDRIGAVPWVHRAQAELRAAGESSPPNRGVAGGILRSLTTQELQVARLAAAGLSNQDIAVRMCISPRTVGYHLYKAYPKLGVTRRIELARFDFADSA